MKSLNRNEERLSINPKQASSQGKTKLRVLLEEIESGKESPLRHINENNELKESDRSESPTVDRASARHHNNSMIVSSCMDVVSALDSLQTSPRPQLDSARYKTMSMTM